jgi:hypothetical protein
VRYVPVVDSNIHVEANSGAFPKLISCREAIPVRIERRKT